VHVEETPGREPPVVLLHRGAGSTRVWDEWAPGIAAGRRLIAYDRRGFGASPRDAVFDQRLFHRDADDLAALLRQLDAAPAHLVGHSDGATVALLTAALHPALVLSVTWIAGHTHLEEPLRQLLLTAPPAEDAEPSTKDWYELWTQTLVGWNIEDELRAVSAPTLVVHATGDRLSPREHAESVARALPHARLSWYETKSHSPHRAERARFERELEAHLRSAEAGAS
jgi:pimeloyl-ACP methyl ester carboxylesterase